MSLFQKLSLAIIIAIGIFVLTGCPESDEPTDGSKTKSTISQISNDEGGSLELDGYALTVIKGAIPSSESSVNTNVSFSIELGVEKPKPLPSGVSQLGKTVLFGPQGFVFNFPIKIYFPVEGNPDPTNLSVLYYDNFEEEWTSIPISSLNDNPKQVGADVIHLGVYALVKNEESAIFNKKSKTQGTKSNGGVRYGMRTSNYWYCLTVKSANLKYPDQAPLWTNLIGRTAMSGTNAPGTNPINPVHMFLPQGTYQIWVSRLNWNRISGGEWSTYSVPATVNVNRPLEFKLWSSDLDYAYSGWYDLQLSGGDWSLGRPEDLPQTDKMVGTGDFQATLTWTNTDSKSTDLDIHLYGPDDLHIYWANKSEEGSGFELDVDMQEDDKGYAVENIYSVTNNLPKGNYRVTVRHYYGYSPKSYNIRIIKFGNSKSYSGSIEEYKEKDIMTFSIN